MELSIERSQSLANRLANTIRNQTYPKSGESQAATALVWLRAPTIVGAHNTGPLIRSKQGFWLAIPTEVAGRGLLVADWARIDTCGRAMASRSKTGRGQVTTPIFLLIPEVKLRKPLDLARDTDRAKG